MIAGKIISTTPVRKYHSEARRRTFCEIIGENDIVEQNSYPTNPPWMHQMIDVDTSLSRSISKHGTPTEIAKQLTERKMAEYSNTTTIFTDASKTKEQ